MEASKGSSTPNPAKHGLRDLPTTKKLEDWIDFCMIFFTETDSFTVDVKLPCHVYIAHKLVTLKDDTVRYSRTWGCEFEKLKGDDLKDRVFKLTKISDLNGDNIPKKQEFVLAAVFHKDDRDCNAFRHVVMSIRKEMKSKLGASQASLPLHPSERSEECYFVEGLREFDSVRRPMNPEIKYIMKQYMLIPEDDVTPRYIGGGWDLIIRRIKKPENDLHVFLQMNVAAENRTTRVVIIFNYSQLEEAKAAFKSIKGNRNEMVNLLTTMCYDPGSYETQIHPATHGYKCPFCYDIFDVLAEITHHRSKKNVIKCTFIDDE